MSSRSQSCRGKNRKPRSWRAGRRETDGLKPLDNLTSGERELSGRNDCEREVAPSVHSPEAEPATVRAKAARLTATD